MKLKDTSVTVNQNQYTDAIRHAVDTVWARYSLEPTCTSGNDGTHKMGSLHGQDRALDIRFWDILGRVAKELKQALPPYYDVVVEMDHVHIEADPRKEVQWNKNSSNISTPSSRASKIK